MKKLCIVILSLVSAVSALAQTKTVTNMDLEKYRQERVESERKLKERYAEMGFSSPEQMEKQNAQRRAEFDAYADQLRIERINAENLQLTQNAMRDAQTEYIFLPNNGYYNQGFIYSNGGGGYFRGSNRPVLRGLRNLPPNMRTAQEYAAMYPGAPSSFIRSNPVRSPARTNRGGFLVNSPRRR